MDQRKRVVRSYKPPRQREVFDDHQWPIDMALVVFGGFMVGSILIYQRFDDPRWYASPWLSITGVVLLIAATIWTLRSVGNHIARRTMQLSVVICAIFHLGMLILSLEKTIFSTILPEPQAARELNTRKPVTIAEYHPSQMQQQETIDREFERPVETEAPQPTPREIERPDQEQPKTPTPPQPHPVPEPEPEVKPEVVKQQAERAVAQPRQSEQQSKLSRQQTKAVKSQNAAVTVPQVTPAARDSNPQLQASASALAKTQATRQQQRKQTSSEPAAAVSQQASNVKRTTRQQQQPASDRSAQPTMQRKTAAAQQTPRTQVVPTQQSAVSVKTPAPTIKPANTLARQQATATPQRTQTPTREMTATTSLAAQQRVSRQDPAPQKPTMAQTPQPVSNRSPRLTERVLAERSRVIELHKSIRFEVPTESSAAAQQQRAQPNAVAKATTENRQQFRSRQPLRIENPTATPSTTQASRATRRETDPARNVAQRANQLQRSQSSALARTNAPVVVTPTANPGTTSTQPAAAQSLQASSASASRSRATSRASGQRSTAVSGPASSATASSQSIGERQNRVVNQPAASSAASASNSLQRAERQAQVAVSPQAVSQPAASTQTAAATPASQPARTAVAKATGGVAGHGKSRNLETALSAASNQAKTSSNAAVRTRATQQNEAGPEIAPSAVAKIQRSRAGAERPSAILSPNSVELATVVASSQPAQATLDAAASLKRSDSRAAKSSQTAAKGNVEIDLGVTQRVDQKNVGRASGGGQPEVSSLPNDAPARQTGKATAQATIASPQVAALAAAPSQAAGGQESPQAAQATGANVARAATNRPEGSSPSKVTEDPNGAAASLSELAQISTRRAQQDAVPVAGSEDEDQQARETMAGKSSTQQLPSSLTGTRVAAAAPPSPQGDGGPAAAAPASAGAPAQLEVGKASTGAEISLASSQPAQATEPLAGSSGQPGSAVAGGPAISRAEATEGASGQPELGGGNELPKRAAKGSPLRAPQLATTITAAGAPQSAGVDKGVPVEAQGDPVGPLAGGINAPASERAAGTAAGDTVVDIPTTGATGISAATRQQKNDSAAGPEMTAADSPGGLVKRASLGRGLPAASTSAAIELPVASPGDNVPDAQASASNSGAQAGPMARRATDNLPVRVDAEEGIGGLGATIAADAGITSRRASSDSDIVQIQPGRFLSKTSRGLPTVNTRAAVATESFQGRKRPGDGGGTSSGDPQTEKAIDIGLAFLARNQLPDGRWTLSHFAEQDDPPMMASDTAATALAILAFQGAGYNHQEYKYQEVVSKGLNFLLSNQREKGDLYVVQTVSAMAKKAKKARTGSSTMPANQAGWLYSHAIATLALCEAYGMTQDPGLQKQTQLAVDFIVAAQDAKGGGWQYRPGESSDTSVSGWMLQALESGRRAELTVPAETYDKVRQWLNKSADPDDKHLYRYNPYHPNNISGQRDVTPPMTSVGLLIRLYTGWQTSETRTISGADYLKEHLPSLGKDKYGGSQRNTYYWYYGTQVMYSMGGEHWKAWHDRLHPLLVNSQRTEGELAGSWKPDNYRWGKYAGRLYVTTMNLLSLEVHYRHLPLYKTGPVKGKVVTDGK